MKVTIFTSNNLRHNFLVNFMSNFCDQLWVVQECRTLFTEKDYSSKKPSELMENYFGKVKEAQNKFFNNLYVSNVNKNISIMPILYGELNNCSLTDLKDFLKSDLYIVFGSSFIKGDLVEFLISKRAINIHAGITPYYRGSDCNFWALYDNNPHLVGTTIHLLSKGLDNGPILYHAMSNHKTNPFEYTMSTLKSAFQSIADKVSDKSIFEIKSLNQDKSKEIRYSKKIEFNDQILKTYLKKNIDLKSKDFDKNMLKDPYFL